MTPAHNAATAWRMVPVEPTPKMLAAAAKAMSPGKRPTPERVSVSEKHRIRFQAMLAAAPAPATSEGQEVRVSGERGVAAHASRDGDDIYCWWETPDEAIQPLIMGLDVATEFHAELSAALARAGGAGWRPIESAPKDGTWIIAAFYRSGELRGLCHAKWATAAFFADLENGDPCQFCAGWYCPNAEDEICATHWRPMPAAPDAGEDGRG